MDLLPLPLPGSAPATVHVPKSTPQKPMEMEMKESEDEQKKNKVDSFFFLPDDILFEILKRVPDAFLRYKVKYVCKKWFKIITNRILLDHASFILQNMQDDNPHRLVDIRVERRRIKLKEQYIDIPAPGAIRHWCNEFLLVSIPLSDKSFHVLNLITNEGSDLPECNLRACFGHYKSTCGMALSLDGFGPFGIRHKVVHLVMGPPVECEIFVFESGVVSNWKKIQVPYMDMGKHIWGEAVSVQGRYMHWRIQGTNDLLSVDMVKEEVCRISLPGCGGRHVYSVFERDGFLTYFDGVTQAKAEIWVLKDFHRVKWKKLRSITINNSYFEKYPHKLLIYRFCCMIRKRYIIMESRAKPHDAMYSYDLKHGTMKKLDISLEYLDKCRVVHSLAPRFL